MINISQTQEKLKALFFVLDDIILIIDNPNTQHSANDEIEINDKLYRIISVTYSLINSTIYYKLKQQGV